MKYAIRLDLDVNQDSIPYCERHNGIIYGCFCMTDGNGNWLLDPSKYEHRRLEGTYKRLQKKYPPYSMNQVVMPSVLTVIDMSHSSNRIVAEAAKAIIVDKKLDPKSLRDLFYAWAMWSPNKS